MPSRGNYEITSREEGNAVQRDESYRSCVLSMLIFTLLCVVLILVSLPWKTFQTRDSPDHQRGEEDPAGAAKMQGHGLTTTARTEASVVTEERQTVRTAVASERYTHELTEIQPTGTTEKSSETFDGTNREFATTVKVNVTTPTVETYPMIESTTPKVGTTSMIEVTTEKVDTSLLNETTTQKVEGTSRGSEVSAWKVEGTSGTETSTRKVEETRTGIGETTEKIEEVSPLIEAMTRNVEKTTWKVEGTTRMNEQTSGKVENVAKHIATTLFNRQTTTPIIRTTEESTSFMINDINESGTTTSSTSITTEAYEVINGNSSSGNSEKLLARIEGSTLIPETTKRSIGDYTSLQKLLVAKYFGNESTTTSSKTEDWLGEMEDKKEHTELSNSSIEIVTSSTVQIHPTTQPVTTTKRIDKSIDTTTMDTKETTLQATDRSNVETIDVCETGSCKQMASKMLSYMNHSSDPCDDFYEYACGGLQADPQINEKILLHRVFETIEVEARKKNSSKNSPLLEYYESCLKYETEIYMDHRSAMAQESLKTIGKFYTNETRPDEMQSITTLFANMLSQNRPILFDILPDVDEKNPDAFTLRIGPAVDDNPFRTMSPLDPCEKENLENLKDHIDLRQQYQLYRKCKKDSEETKKAVTKALKDIGIFEELENPQKESYLNETVKNIYRQMILGIQTYFQVDSEIREAYRSKTYSVTTLGELESTWKLLNWTQLLESLTGQTFGPNIELQVYFKRDLTSVMQRLEKSYHKDKRVLNNALLGLYARNLYRDLVAPRSRRDLEKKCFNAAAHFMQTEASSLYLSSFSTSEIENMQALIQSAFHELRETLRVALKKSEWAVDWGREVLLKKIDDMRISIPHISRMNNGYESELNITDNYFENSMSLMKKYRSTMYRVLKKDPNDPEQIWTFFASPYQSRPRTIYGLNLIVVPFGAIDWSLLSGHMTKLDYVSLATVGDLVAREIAHNFDTNGIRYWNGSRDSDFALMTDNDWTKENFKEYLDCQSTSIFKDPVEMTLPITGQRLTFTVPSLTVNERLSDAVGMRLAHDTLVRLGKIASEKRLPWLDLDVSQLYYLVYTQAHCTKAYLPSSYVKLYEDPTLPSRVRIFVAATNNKKFGESWNCPEGSQLLPSFTCGVFPHLEYRGVMPDAA